MGNRRFLRPTHNHGARPAIISPEIWQFIGRKRPSQEPIWGGPQFRNPPIRGPPYDPSRRRYRQEIYGGRPALYCNSPPTGRAPAKRTPAILEIGNSTGQKTASSDNDSGNSHFANDNARKRAMSSGSFHGVRKFGGPDATFAFVDFGSYHPEGSGDTIAEN